jgi:hypothetical protein
MLPDEEVNVAEVIHTAAQVELPGPEGGLVVGVESEGRIFAQIRWRDEETSSDLVLALASLARNQRHHDTARIEVPPLSGRPTHPAKGLVGSSGRAGAQTPHEHISSCAGFYP